MQQVILNPLPPPLTLDFYIPELSADPVSPAAQDAWVLRQGAGGSGGGKLKMFLGLGFPYVKPNSGGAFTYQFSYRTQEGTTKRVTIS